MGDDVEPADDVEGLVVGLEDVLHAGQVSELEPELEHLEGVLHGLGELGSSQRDGLEEPGEGVCDEFGEGRVFRRVDLRLLLEREQLDALEVGEAEHVPGVDVLAVVAERLVEELEHAVEAFLRVFGQALREPGAELAAEVRLEQVVDVEHAEELADVFVDLLVVHFFELVHLLELRQVELGGDLGLQQEGCFWPLGGFGQHFGVAVEQRGLVSRGCSHLEELLAVSSADHLELEFGEDALAEVDLVLLDGQLREAEHDGHHLALFEEQGPHGDDLEPVGHVFFDSFDAVDPEL